MGRELALQGGLPACHQKSPRVGVGTQKKGCACVWMGGRRKEGRRSHRQEARHAHLCPMGGFWEAPKPRAGLQERS